MWSVTQSQAKRLTAVHGWSGTILGLLLYAVVVTGTVAVFANEIAVWSIGGARQPGALSMDIDAKARSAIDRLTPGYQQGIGIWADARGDLMVFPHAHVRNPDTGEIDDYGSLFRLNPDTGEILARQEGFAWQNTDWYDPSALHDFLVNLHVRLYTPEPWGLILTGVLGLATMAAGLSGIIIHRHLIRDLFVAERPGRRLVAARDRHVLAATWALPFAFLLGFSGSFYSFAGTVTFPLLANVAFGGDKERMAEVLYEPAVTPNPTPTPLADIDGIVEDARARYGTPVTYIGISNYGRADARLHVWNASPSGRLPYVQSLYDGATGAYLGILPRVGRTPSLGGTMYELMTPLHFGHFAGVLSKSLWVGLGSAMAFVVISGLRLWVRRRQDDALWRGFGRAVTAAGYGLPVAMLSSAHVYFLAMASRADAFWWTPTGFLIGVLPAVLPGFLLGNEESAKRCYRAMLGLGVLSLPVARMATGGLDWAAALAQGQGTVLSVDVTLLTLGAGLLWWARRTVPSTAPQPAPAR